jgi:hypothetical protein
MQAIQSLQHCTALHWTRLWALHHAGWRAAAVYAAFPPQARRLSAAASRARFVSPENGALP